MEEYLAVFVTVPTIESAEEIARALVEDNLAPCVNILPSIVSIYAWQGAVNRDAECFMIAKCARSRFAAVAASVTRVHPYEVPEIIAVPLAEIAEPYRRYLESF